MSKFKVGDKVIRVQDRADLIPVGTVTTVQGVWGSKGQNIYVTGYKGVPNANNFEHYVEQAAVDSTAVLTPLEVFECILAGTPLEYSVKSMAGKPVWYDVVNPENINVEHIECANYRVKPQTVKVNGVDVPAPAKAFTEEGYGVNLLRNEVFKLGSNTHYAGVSWSTEAEAQEVLDAIMTSFSK